MLSEVLVARWQTPAGQACRERVLAKLSAGGPWRSELRGVAGMALLGEDLGDLRGIDLAGDDLQGADLAHTRLEGAIFDGAKLARATLHGANLSHASLRRADCRGTNLCAVTALGACFDHADLSDACICCANLAGASLKLTRLTRANLSNATLANAVALAANIEGTILLYCDLEGAHLAGVSGKRLRPKSQAEQVFWAHFPSYEDAIPHYMRLLRACQWAALLSVEGCTLSSSDPIGEITHLLEHRNWRIQLVGIVALLFVSSPRTALPALWRVADTSWVTWQAVAVAYLLDENFAAEAADRIRAAQAGRPHYPKELGSLAALYPRLPEARPDLVAWFASESGRKSLSGECEWGKAFVPRWLDSLTRNATKEVQKLWRRSACP